MIFLADYWMGRDSRYCEELTEETRSNAELLIARVNVVLLMASQDRVEPGLDPDSGTMVSSGWRPKAVNKTTPNASPTSKHVIGCAIDICDTPERALARWCLRNLDRLKEIGLWMEDPRWTPTWVHLQSIPPASGDRVFIPSETPTLCAALPEQLAA